MIDRLMDNENIGKLHPWWLYTNNNYSIFSSIYGLRQGHSSWRKRPVYFPFHCFQTWSLHRVLEQQRTAQALPDLVHIAIKCNVSQKEKVQVENRSLIRTARIEADWNPQILLEDATAVMKTCLLLRISVLAYFLTYIWLKVLGFSSTDRSLHMAGGFGLSC